MLACLVFLWCLLNVTSSLAIPKQEGKSNRVFETVLSDEEHYNEEDLHNVEYDHEAFLGENTAKSFNDLSPEESKLRLGKIVNRIDVDKDGFVTMEELKDWIQYTQKRYILEDAEHQWKGLTSGNKMKLSWQEYKRLTYGISPDANITETFQYKDMLDRDYRRWQHADIDKDGALTKEEFTDFIHPEEAAHMKHIVVLETMDDIDKDKDGKVSIDEYIGDMYGDIETDEDPDWIQNERRQFIEYRDKNKDGFMDMEEVSKWILPDDYDNSEAEARHLVYESDVNRDNKLSKEEIIDKYDLFVGSQATDFGEALVRHDEF